MRRVTRRLSIIIRNRKAAELHFLLQQIDLHAVPTIDLPDVIKKSGLVALMDAHLTNLALLDTELVIRETNFSHSILIQRQKLVPLILRAKIIAIFKTFNHILPANVLCYELVGQTLAHVNRSDSTNDRRISVFVPST